MRYKEIRKHIVKNEDGVELASFLEERHARDYMELRKRLDKQKYSIVVEIRQVRAGRQ